MALRRVARLLVEPAQQREAREVARVLVLELLHELGQPLVGAVDLGDDLVDLRAQRALLAGRSRARASASRAPRRSRAPWPAPARAPSARARARGCRPRPPHDVLRARPRPARTRRGCRARARARPSRRGSSARAPRAAGGSPCAASQSFCVEGEAHERAERLLLVGLHGEQRQGLLVAGARVGRSPRSW